VKSYLPLIGMIFLIGCGPNIHITPPQNTGTQDSGTIKINIDNNHQPYDQPVIRLFPKYQPHLTHDITRLVHKDESGTLTVKLPPLQPGEYRIVMEVPYTVRFAGLPVGGSIKRVAADFVINKTLSVSCFRFDNKQKDVMQWSSHGVYINNREKPVSKETCPGLFYINSSWPYPLNDTSHGGSLFVPVSSECFPKTSPQLSEPSQWTFAIVSPDLRELQEWQNIKAIRFRMATRSIAVTVSPEVKYLVNNIEASTSTTQQPAPIFNVNSGRWSDHKFEFKLPKTAKVSHIIFHVYGVPEKTVSDTVDSVYLDAVCPVN
jgi:hypothetical protein